MRAPSLPDDRVAEAARRRLEALVAELDGEGGRVRAGSADPSIGLEDDLLEDVPDGADGSDADLSGDLPGGGRHARRPLPVPGRAALWIGDRTPASITRWSLGARHVVVVSGLLVAGLLLAGWSYLRSTGGDHAGEVVAPRSSGGVPVGLPGEEPGNGGQGELATGPATSARPAPAAASPAAELVVDVEGKVRRPGIAVLPAGSRVVDALEAAGGARPGADLRDLNLARLLVDGEQLLVGVAPASGVAAGALSEPPGTAAPGTTSGPGSTAGTAPVALVDLNTADQAALETLPGVGPVTAAAILQWRTEHGAFTSVDELLEVSGIGDATLAEIAPHVTL